MSSDTTTDSNPSPPRPPEPTASTRTGTSRRPLIIAIIVAGVVLLVVGGILLLTRSSPKATTKGAGTGASPTEVKAMAMCGVVSGIIDDPTAQVQPELTRRVQAILKVGSDAGDRYQVTVTKLASQTGAGDTAVAMQTVTELQELCQPTKPAG